MALKERLRHRHFIEDRGTELVVGFLLFVVACLLLYDAFDARGHSAPWPASKFVPW